MSRAKRLSPVFIANFKQLAKMPKHAVSLVLHSALTGRRLRVEHGYIALGLMELLKPITTKVERVRTEKYFAQLFVGELLPGYPWEVAIDE